MPQVRVSFALGEDCAEFTRYQRMSLRFLPPLSKHEQSIIVSLPKFSGHVMDPRYVPPQHRQQYETDLDVWLGKTDQRDWPRWLAEYVAERKAQRAAASTDDQPTVPTGD